MASPEKSLRREAIAILALTALGGMIRLAGVGRVGLTHFDEGIYALAGGWIFGPDGLGGIDPGLIPYAPPAYVVLVGLAYQILGASDVSAILVSILASTLTIPVIGLTARRIFGSGAGAAAAAIVAMAVPHVVFSRMALTDSTFVLLWAAGLWAGSAFLDRPTFARSILLGAVVGLAQLTKYNGWLIGGIVAASAVCGAATDATERHPRRLARTFGLGFLAAVISALVYAPWFQFVERQSGGYSALLAHQRSYLGGIDQWPAHLLTQLDQAVALSGGWPWRAGGLSLAYMAVAFTRGKSFGRATLLPLVLMLGLGLAPNLGWYLMAAALPWTLASHSGGVRFLGIAWLIPAILTPFYHPYARLWLPLEAAGWIGVAAFLPRVSAENIWPPRIEVRARGYLAAALVVVIGSILWRATRPEAARPLPDSLAATDSLRIAVARLARSVPESVSSVKLLARPPVVFYLSGRISTRRLPELESLTSLDGSGEWAIVDEVQLRQEADGLARFESELPRWEVVKVDENTLGAATRLDVDPSATTSGRPSPPERLWLLKPARPR